MAATLTGDYREFGDIAIAVLDMRAAAEGLRLKAKDVDPLRNGLKELPAFPEVKSALRRLKKAGFRLAVLTNSAPASLSKQLEHSKLGQYFEQALSVDSVQRFKPASETYKYAAQALGVETSDILMVAAHPWDLAGASRAGCKTAFIKKPGKALMPGARVPDYVSSHLKDLADQLTKDVRPKPVSMGKAAVANLILTGGMALGVAAVMTCTAVARRPAARA